MLRNVFILFSGNVVAQLLSFLSGIIVIKMLTVSQYGEYTTITSFLNMIILPIAGFFSLALRRYVPIYLNKGELGKLKGLINTSFFYSLVLITILIPTAFFSSSIIANNVLKVSYQYFILYIFAVSFMIINSPLFAIQLGYEKFKQYTYSVNIIPNAGRTAYLILWWLFFPFKMFGAISSLIFKSFISTIMSYVSVREDLSNLNVRAEYDLKEWIKFSLPNFLRFLVSYAAQNIGVVLLGSMRTFSEAGIFKASSIITMVVHNITLAFSSVFLPRVSKLTSAYDKVKEVKNFSFMNLLVTSAFILPFIIAGDKILGLLGKEYVAGYKVLLIMSIMLLLESWSSSWQGYITAVGRTDLNLITYSVSSVVSIFASYFFIRYIGIFGAAFAIVVEAFLNYVFRLYWGFSLSGKLFLESRSLILFVLIFVLLAFRLSTM